jgi:hypothetical protein
VSLVLFCVRTNYRGITAHGRENQAAHVNPPGDGEQLDEKPLLELPDPHENDDIRRQVSRSPHEGQLTLSSLSDGNINCSKVFPHLLHLNS